MKAVSISPRRYSISSADARIAGASGCVRGVARVAGVSNTTAYRMKWRFPLFSDAWERALVRAGEGLTALAYKRAVEGKETIIIRGGQDVERRITPSDAILRLLLKRGDGWGLPDGQANAARKLAKPVHG